jgi:hypothetical protein
VRGHETAAAHNRTSDLEPRHDGRDNTGAGIPVLSATRFPALFTMGSTASAVSFARAAVVTIDVDRVGVAPNLGRWPTSTPAAAGAGIHQAAVGAIPDLGVRAGQHMPAPPPIDSRILTPALSGLSIGIDAAGADDPEGDDSEPAVSLANRGVAAGQQVKRLGLSVGSSSRRAGTSVGRFFGRAGKSIAAGF